VVTVLLTKPIEESKIISGGFWLHDSQVTTHFLRSGSSNNPVRAAAQSRFIDDVFQLVTLFYDHIGRCRFNK